MIKLFTDDGADINFNTRERYGITQLPIAVSDGENEFETGRAIDISNFYDNMRAGTIYSTSRVMPQVMCSVCIPIGSGMRMLSLLARWP